MNIAKVIDWKFNHQPNMRCKEIEGVLQIIEFPGGIPSQADQDIWTAEYNDIVLREQRKTEITAEADVLCDTQTGYPRIAIRNLMMVVMDINIRGKVSSSQLDRDAAQTKLDSLIPLGDYVIAVRTEELNRNLEVDALPEGVNPQTIIPNWPNLP